MHSKSPIELEGESIAAELHLADEVTGEDGEDTRLLRKMSKAASVYISAFSWCGSVLESYFAGGLAEVFCVFFFHIRPTRPDVDPWIWVVVGDIPPAYLPLADCKSSSEFFRTYIRGMAKWVEFARQGREGTPKEGVPPVNVPATPEWAEKVDQRLQGLLLAVKPFFDDEPGREN